MLRQGFWFLFLVEEEYMGVGDQLSGEGLDSSRRKLAKESYHKS